MNTSLDEFMEIPENCSSWIYPAFCSHSKWNDDPYGSDVDRYKAEIILINFALGNNF